MAARSYGLALSIEGALRELRPGLDARPTGPNKIGLAKNGEVMSTSEAYALLTVEKVRGRKVIPMSKECGNPCPRGCPGFNYGAGCPGVEITEDQP